VETGCLFDRHQHVLCASHSTLQPELAAKDNAEFRHTLLYHLAGHIKQQPSLRKFFMLL
jgi:hypothetical protein